MIVSFNYHSKTARKARLFVLFSRKVILFVSLLIALMAVMGSMLWLTDPLFGAIIIATAIAVMLPIIWYEYDLSKLQPNEIVGDKVKAEEFLATNVVGRLRSIDSAYEIWHGIHGTWQQRFFSLRFSIESSIFEGLSKDKSNLEEVWQYAADLSGKHGERGISTASLLVALVRTLDEYEAMLGERGLDLTELESSIDWIHHTERVLSKIGKNHQFGGIARDWTSGFTPTLNRMSHNMTIDIEHGGYMHRDLTAHRTVINEMVKFLASGRQNVMLVGEVGVGKTISAYGFTQRIMIDELTPDSIKYNQVFHLEASTITAISKDPSKIEATVISIINEAQKAKNAILFFDDASVFFSQGTGAVDLSKLLLPVLQGNLVPMIFSMTPENWQKFSVDNQAIAGLMNYLVVPEPEKNESMRVLEDQALLIEAQHRVFITYQALEQAYDLSARYVKEIAAPGRAMRVVENSVNHAEGKMITANSIQQSIEATYGVKVQVAASAEKEELLNLEAKIHERMINQNRAVKVVSDSLRRSRSGVSSPNKPIGTFLFLGPTGVGKTELAKAVADVYFGDDKKMIRVDMNEFIETSDISRLLDSSSPTSLLSVVGRDPFTVVLFDEIEKANPEVVNVLLQLLDEGVMRNDKNKEVSFLDTIIISTSNAGADSIRSYIDAGHEVEQIEKPFVDSLISSNIFKPEFLNRFDEIVIFRPLKQEELLKVVDLLITNVNQNLAKQKVAVELTINAKKWLVKKGYDPKLGARPLRRMVQRTVENVVAKRILKSDFKPGSSITLDVKDLAAEEPQ